MGKSETSPSQPRIGDAFGQVLERCWSSGVKDGEVFEVVERDDGYLTVGDTARYFQSRQLWSSVEQWGFDQVRGRVLDVGCGAGRHAVELINAGHDVLGFDPSPGAARVAEERGVNVVCGTLSDLGSDQRDFDDTILLGNNLGLIPSGGAGKHFLAELASRSAPGARLIGSGIDPYDTDIPEHLAYHERNMERGLLAGHLKIRVRDGFIATEWFDYVFRSPAELEDVIAGTGWVLGDIAQENEAYCVRLDRSR